MHPSLQFLDFSYLTLREKDRGHLPQKVNKNEIRHGTEAGGDCADALKHKMGCLSEDPKTLGAEMTFELQNRQITEAEIDGNTCFMYYVWHFLSDALEKSPSRSPLLLTYSYIKEILDICPP